MKIKIRRYPTWFGLYQLVDVFVKNEDKAHKIAGIIDNKFPKINKFFTWLHSKKGRKDKIIIEPFDTWSADFTLSKIIVPVLQQLKDTKHGSPIVDNEDVPEELRDTQDEYGWGEKCQEKWDWVMGEMIYGFQFILDDEDSYHENRLDMEAYNIKRLRAENGRRLFAKYYEGLWD